MARGKRGVVALKPCLAVIMRQDRLVEIGGRKGAVDNIGRDAVVDRDLLEVFEPGSEAVRAVAALRGVCRGAANGRSREGCEG